MLGKSAPWKWRLAVDVLALISFIAIILAGWALYSRFGDTDRRRAENDRTWHGVICAIEQSVISNRGLTITQKRSAIKFYDGLLIRQVGTPGCGYIVKLSRR